MPKTPTKADHKPRLGSIGQRKLPGLSKMVEENGEALQIIGKIQQIGHMGLHWDGKKKTLKQRLEDEVADQVAAILFFSKTNGLDMVAINKRVAFKEKRFNRWHTNVLAGRDPNDDGKKEKKVEHVRKGNSRQHKPSGN